MLGAIIGDIIGSRFEFNNVKEEAFDLFHDSSTFTDDTVLTVATADGILSQSDFLKKYQSSYFNYPNRGWGGMFNSLAKMGDLRPYNSYGNGSAMRVAPCGWAYDTLRETMNSAKETALVTHNHPEGIKGAQAIASAIFMARNGLSKDGIMEHVGSMGYDLSKSLSEFPRRKFDETCQGTIPMCMAMFNESNDYETAIKTAIRQGGDCDTTACIVGAMAEACYGKPSQYMIDEAWKRLPEEMRRIVFQFVRKFCYNDFEEPTVKMDKQGKLAYALRFLFFKLNK